MNEAPIIYLMISGARRHLSHKEVLEILATTGVPFQKTESLFLFGVSATADAEWIKYLKEQGLEVMLPIHRTVRMELTK